MKGILTLVIFFISAYAGIAQQKIFGSVIDEADKTKLAQATVMLLQAKDSILIAYGRADEKGVFSLERPATGSFLLIVSYPKYSDFYTPVEGGDGPVNLKEVSLTSIQHILEEVLVTGRIPIVMKGDTTEYDAASFKVEENAKVEDLLKVLPGITVDASGSITAQGKVVKKVLVDGEEFFGDDPTLVTRNIRSDMVDKVQVYEKMSDEAERTGVDDGQREQTINVKLREDSKNGMFGKLLGGGGTDEYYMGQIMLNKFKGSQKIAAYGLFGNNGTTSMNWEDAQKFGGDSGVSYGDDGSISVNGGFSDDFSGRGAVGIPKAINSGINFSDKWDGDRHGVNINYKYGQIQSDGEERTFRSGTLNDNTTKGVETENDQHRVNLRYDLKLDSLNSLTVKSNLSQRNTWRYESVKTESMDFQTTNESKETTDNKINTVNVEALYTHKFPKKGRSLTLTGGLSSDRTSGNGHLYAVLTQKDGEADETDQRKDRMQELNRYRGSIVYTEPLMKDLNLSVGYSITNNQNTSVLESFNKAPDGSYTELDRTYSNNYDFQSLGQAYQLTIGFKEEKLRFNLTNSLNEDRLNQVNNYDNRRLTRTFVTYNPRLNGGYNFSKNKNLWFNYSGRNQLPSLNQIQPLLNNSDPQNIFVGNEDLRPAFRHSANMGYSTFSILSGNYKYIGGNIVLTKDPISQNITRDIDEGVNYFTWDNIAGRTNSSYNLWSGYYFKLFKALNVANSPQLNASWSNSYNFFEGEENKIRTTNYNVRYNLQRQTNTGFNFDVNFMPQYRQMTSSLQPDQDNNGFVFGAQGNLSYYLTKTFKIYTNYNYTYEAPTDAFASSFNQFLIHPGVSKKFLKNESLMVDFTVNDVLDQNRGFSRNVSNSVFVQRSFETIRRYYMLKVSWDFSKMFVK
ncbi:outer membrane beta-barrel protein [Sphingobacterium sp. SGG-5]|uniref:outer membrane beta-barrel family protein n=1 Tax=Sphingobacterium sp. SGG-5 TaxID=2710881 RepID=UPI0013EBDB14|nr:outer membrane beta-barrel family protein [Sphingobacterium sp. SGG-5]NGM61203.1 outer membrane beta-barrel protein [Sphingobacterium sp. SGG-5]